MQVAFRTGQGKVVETVCSAMFTRNDVLDVQRNEWRINLPSLAILATTFRPLANQGARFRIHCLRDSMRNTETCFGLQDGKQIVRFQVGLVFGLLGRRKLAFVRFFA